MDGLYFTNIFFMSLENDFILRLRFHPKYSSIGKQNRELIEKRRRKVEERRQMLGHEFTA